MTTTMMNVTTTHIRRTPAANELAFGEDLEASLARLRGLQAAEGIPSYETRIHRLKRLKSALLVRKHEIAAAVSRDFGHRSRHESLMAEVFFTLRAIDYTISHLHGWMKVRRRPVSWLFPMGRACVAYQPLGVVGIISPWNYPVHLALAPLATAIAAGNRVMLKPSELTPTTSRLLEELLMEALGPEVASVITGGPATGAAFARLPFDHLFFTGSTRVARLILRDAAEHLTPATLELGGKSPAIIGKDFPSEKAAGRIMTGKLFNAGQTCLAPDHALVPAGRMGEFVAACCQAVAAMYPSLTGNDDYTSIINDDHYRRLESYVADARARGADVIEINPQAEAPDRVGRKFFPTLIANATPEMLVMKEEIFGPILPIMSYASLSEAIAFVNANPRPLALYYFGYDGRDIDEVINSTMSGGVTINETCLHAALDDLPFGGVGPSGMGEYHAFEGFETFSKKRAIFRQGPIDTGRFLRPPFAGAVDRALNLMLGR
ncbi:coniferyl aldehyde dehydrogenase [Pendulispora brunnea]|uniref:Aldehyde dehydrogenase n=1 Tax=Pendulispora brunnea TaxID=2905690 RepID=A0ABZ2K2U3_9BACT